MASGVDDPDLTICLHDMRLARRLGLTPDWSAMRSHRNAKIIAGAMADVGVRAEEAWWNMRYNLHIIYKDQRGAA